MPFNPRLVFVTASSTDEARKVAKAILDKRLAACVNIVPGLESHYWWQGELETTAEVLLVIKSSAERFGSLQATIHQHHSYECPEIVAVAPQEISSDYRAWWETSFDTGH